MESSSGTSGAGAGATTTMTTPMPPEEEDHQQKHDEEEEEETAAAAAATTGGEEGDGIPTEGGVKLDALEEGAAFDAETFVKAERDFQQVLVDLVGDASLERFRGEYEKLHRALKKSHESERRLLGRCRALNNEIVTNAAKVQTALRLSQEDQRTIAQLRRELDKAWAMVDLSHRKEAQAKDTVQKMKVEVANLTRLVEQGAGLSVGQEQSVKELLRIKDELTRERDALRAQVEAVRADATALAEQLQAQERERAAADAQVKGLRTALAAKSVDTEKEQFRRKALEEQLRDLKQQLEARQAELRQRQLQQQKAQAQAANLERQLAEQRALTEKALKDSEVLNMRTVKLSQDLEEEIERNSQLLAEGTQRAAELKQREDTIRDMESAEQRMARARRKLAERAKALEQQIEQAEKSKGALQQEITGLHREIETHKRQHEQDRKALEDLQRDREMLNRKVEKASSETADQQGLVRTGEATRQNLQQEIESFKQENQRQRREIYALERERERSVADAQAATSTYLQAMEEVKLREATIADLEKRIAEQEAKLKQQKALYEAIRAERNLYSKNLIESQEEVAEMQRKFKILNHQIEQLKEEIAAKSVAQVNEHYQLVRVQKLRDKYKSELDRLSRDVDAADRTVSKQQDEIKHLAAIIAGLEADVARQRKETEIVANEKDVLMQQLVRRNEEIALLYEKIELQQRALTNGEAQYRKKAEDVQLLRTRIADTRREIVNLRAAASQGDTLKTETYQLQRELLAERAKVRALSDELENPMNIHRWRKLQGSDPAAFEMIQKIQALQRRLIAKTEQLVERDAEIQEKHARIAELEQSLSRHATAGSPAGMPESVSQQLVVYRQSLAEKTRQLKSLQSELVSYQSQAAAHKADIERLTAELNDLKRKFYDRKRREQTSRLQQQQQSMATTQQQRQARTTFGGGFSTKAGGVGGRPEGLSFDEACPPVPSAATTTTATTTTTTVSAVDVDEDEDAAIPSATEAPPHPQ